MAARPRMISNRRDSNIIRASVYDACLELGALDDNSLVAEWMFGDPSLDGNSSFYRRHRMTRFQEVIAESEQNADTKPQRRRFLPFSIKAPEFTARLYAKVKRYSKANRASVIHDDSQEPSAHQIGPTHISLSRGSFFRRSIYKSVISDAPQTGENAQAEHMGEDGSRISMRRKSFFQRKLRRQVVASSVYSTDTMPEAETNIITPIHHMHSSESVTNTSHLQHADTRQSLRDIPEDDEDDDWEEIEAIPGSPMYPLHNKGINPPALMSIDKKLRASLSSADTDPDEADIRGITHYNLSIALPRLIKFRRPSSRTGRASPASQSKDSPKRGSLTLSTTSSSSPRKALRVLTKKGRHSRTPSGGSLPPSPFVLVSANNVSATNQPTSRIVFSEDEPVRPLSMSDAQRRRSMGYHHQFFVDKDEEQSSKRPRSVSVPVQPPQADQKPLPFPTMKGT